MYNPAHFFYPNALKRYALGTKNKLLKYNDDGDLTIYLGNKSPGKEKESNWLPAPAGNFLIWLRAYWPDKAIRDGVLEVDQLLVSCRLVVFQRQCDPVDIPRICAVHRSAAVAKVNATMAGCDGRSERSNLSWSPASRWKERAVGNGAGRRPARLPPSAPAFSKQPSRNKLPLAFRRECPPRPRPRHGP